jgi:hypothetical protein
MPALESCDLRAAAISEVPGNLNAHAREAVRLPILAMDAGRAARRPGYRHAAREQQSLGSHDRSVPCPMEGYEWFVDRGAGTRTRLAGRELQDNFSQRLALLTLGFGDRR